MISNNYSVHSRRIYYNSAYSGSDRSGSSNFARRDAADRAAGYRRSSGRRSLRREQQRKLRHMKRVIVIMMIFLAAVLLLLHFTANRTEAEKVNVPTYKYYTSIEVDQGESLWSIASDHMSPEYRDIYDYMSEIASINHLHGDQLDRGQRIIIPYYSTELKE